MELQGGQPGEGGLPCDPEVWRAPELDKGEGASPQERPLCS